MAAAIRSGCEQLNSSACAPSSRGGERRGGDALSRAQPRRDVRVVVERERDPQRAVVAGDRGRRRGGLGDRALRLGQPQVDVRRLARDQVGEQRRRALRHEQVGPVRAEQRRQRAGDAHRRARPRRPPRRASRPASAGQLAAARGEPLLAEVERHDRVGVRRDHVRPGLDEGAVRAGHPVGALEQRQRRPLGLAERARPCAPAGGPCRRRGS